MKTNKNAIGVGCDALFSIGDTVTVADGASKWMRERGFWIDEWPESIDGMTFTVIADYTNLCGDSSHWWLENDAVKDCGVNPKFILLNTQDHPRQSAASQVQEP